MRVVNSVVWVMLSLLVLLCPCQTVTITAGDGDDSSRGCHHWYYHHTKVRLVLPETVWYVDGCNSLGEACTAYAVTMRHAG